MSNKASAMMLTLVIVTACFVLTFPTEQVRAADPPNGATTNVYDNWTITTSLTYTSGTNIYMWGWNITVKNGGSLTLDAATITFYPNITDHCGFIVESGGTLIMKNNAMITDVGLSSSWIGFLPGSTINITNSILRGDAGKVPGQTVTGIYVGATNAIINDSVLWSNPNYTPTGVIYLNGKGTVFTNNTVRSRGMSAVYVNNTEAMINDNTIYLDSGGPTTANGIKAITSQVNMTGNNIYGFRTGVNVSGGVLHAMADLVHDNTIDGFYITLSAYVYLDHVEMWGNYNGVNALYSNVSGYKNYIHNNAMDGYNTYLSTVNLTKEDIRNNGGQDLNLRHSYGIVDKCNIANTGGTNALVRISESSNLTMANNIIDGPSAFAALMGISASNVNLQYNMFKDDVILLVTNGVSNVKMEGNTFTNTWIANIVDEYSNVVSSKNVISDILIGYQVETMSSLVTSDDTFTVSSANAAYYAVNSTIEAYRANLNMTTDVTLAYTDYGGDIKLFDCAANRSHPALLTAFNGRILSVSGTPTLNDSTVGLAGIVDIGWYAEAATRWQNDATAPNATVFFNDTVGWNAASLVTDATGLSQRAVVIQDTRDATGNHTHNDYVATALLNGMKGTKMFNASKDLVGADKILVNLNDNSNPSIVIVKPDTGLITNNATVRINGTASDMGSELYRVQVDPGTGLIDAVGLADWEFIATLPEGNNTISAKATDLAGNAVNTSIYVVVDLTAPVITVTEPTGLYLRTGTFDLNGTTEANSIITVDGAPATVTGTDFTIHKVVADGDYYFVINATDAAGNKNSITKHYIVDTTPPDVSIDIADGTYFTTTAVTVTGWTTGTSVSVNGLNATIDPVKRTYTVDMSFVEGPNNVTVEASDIAGNTKTVDIVINIDTLPPEITITSPEGARPVTTNVATFAIAGTVTGASELKMDGAPLTFGTDGVFNTTVTLVQGENVFTIAAKDLAGNAAEATVTAILDNIAPIVAITSPASGLVTNAASVTVTGTVDDITAILASGDLNVTNDNGAFTFTNSLVGGITTITVRATDAMGNTNEATITVTQDTDAGLTVTGPTQKEYKTKDDTVKITGTSEPGSKVYINDALVSDADGSFSYEWPLKVGENKITVKTVDPSGNEMSETYTITKEKEEVSPTESIKGSNNLILAIILLIVGVAVGAIVGYVAGKPKQQTPPEEPASRPSRPAREEPPPKREAPKAAPAPAPAKAEAKAAPRKEAPAPKPEPKPEPKKEAPKKEAPKKEEPKKKAEEDVDEDIDDILKKIK